MQFFSIKPNPHACFDPCRRTTTHVTTPTEYASCFIFHLVDGSPQPTVLLCFSHPTLRGLINICARRSPFWTPVTRRRHHPHMNSFPGQRTEDASRHLVTFKHSQKDPLGMMVFQASLFFPIIGCPIQWAHMCQYSNPGSDW